MVSEKKKNFVLQLTAEIKSCPIIGILNLENLPAQQLQKMRPLLTSKGIKLVMARKNLLNLALKGSNLPNIENLAAKIRGMPALLFSRENPFTLYAILQKSKSEAPAKAGQTAPREIIVKAGPTNFVPGPIISELAAVGIKTKVEAGKLAILADTIVAKEGDIITSKLAETLKRLDIKPMEIGLNLVAAWENGTIFEAKQLRIDEAEYIQNIIDAFTSARNLAVEIAFPTAETTEMLVQKAFNEAKALAIEQDIITEETRDQILAKAEAQALSVKDEGQIEAQVEPKPKSESLVQDEDAEDELVEEKPAEHVTRLKASDSVDLKEDIKPVQQKATPKAADIEKPKFNESKFDGPKFNGPKFNEKPLTAEDLLRQSVESHKNQTESKPKQWHPKQGDVSTEEVADLFSNLQKKGTLR